MLMLIQYLLLFALPFVPSFNRAEARPPWSARRPQLPGYWAGIGVALIDGQLAAARENARSAALRDIAAQIATQVRGEVYYEQKEGADGYSHDYRAAVYTQVETELEQVEIVDTWDDGERFWVYARLSVDEHQQRIEKRIEAARERVDALRRQAALCEERAASTALGLYVRAFAIAAREKALSSVRSEIATRIQYLLANIDLRAEPVQHAVQRGVALNLELVLRARYRGAPVAGLPLSLRFIEGRGQFVGAESSDSGSAGRVLTDSSGTGRACLLRISGSERVQRVVARFDLSALAPETNGRPQPFNTPFAVFDLQVAPRHVHLTCSGDTALVAPLCAELRATLGQHGLELVEVPKQADLLLRIVAASSGHRSFGALHFAYLEAELELRDARGNARIHRRISAVKGAGATRAQAEVSACVKAFHKIEHNALPEVLAAFNQ